MSNGKKTGYIYNLVSLAGILLAVVATGLIVAMLAVEAFTGVENPYLGIMTYFIFPGMLIFGLLLVPLGMHRVREKRRVSAPEEIKPFPVLDLNDKHNRRSVIFFVCASVVFVMIVMVATIKGYEFTESPTFCGELCHVPMEPEHTAWQNSPHANVKCVECHVGPGAQWYVKAKISGMRQLYAVVAGTYPTPIHAPVVNLRPAMQTCGHCHWPEKFYFGRQKIFYHYAPNEQNTPREIDMMLKLGESPKATEGKGIHGHIGKEIYYVARDHKRLDLPYVMIKEKDGTVTEYVNTEKPMSKEDVAKGERRLMDCIDCHNRPTHIYRSPNREMDESLAAGRIDPALPYVKKVAVEILSRSYKTKEEALSVIAAELPKYYATNYPGIASQKAAAIKQAVDQVQGIYSRNFFPKMKVDWKTYPNHIGHVESPGCFRCHDGKHKTASGKTISKDCNICHKILSQKQENIPAGASVKAFVHPVDIGTAIYTTNCSECHMAAAEEAAAGGHH